MELEDKKAEVILRKIMELNERKKRIALAMDAELSRLLQVTAKIGELTEQLRKYENSRN